MLTGYLLILLFAMRLTTSEISDYGDASRQTHFSDGDFDLCEFSLANT